MFDKPLFTKLSEKTTDIALLLLVTLMYIATCAEADMYVPAFPQMIQYFGVEENQIQLILSLNFAGLCLAGIVTGPLSDSYGRRKVLLGGLFLFLVSSVGCVYTSDFNMMLGMRLIQGVAASVPTVIGAATFLDKYSAQKAGQILGLMNGVISASMAGAPIVGAWLSQVYSWRANFVAILALATLSFIGTWLFIEETLPVEKRKPLNMISVFKDYAKLSKSLEFMGYSLIVWFPFSAIVVYIANISIIFVNHMDMSLELFSLYQASTMGTFIVFSLLSMKLIGKMGLDYTKNLGSFFTLIGAAGLFWTCQVDMDNANMICFFMAFIAAGGAMMAGTFGMKVVSIFPDIYGTSMAMTTAIRQFLAGGLVILSEVMFDGTIVPVATIIFGYAIVAALCFLILCSKSSNAWIAQAPPAS
ncbi:MAG: MFS transporter [Alphaproteobacteria bacterium]|jgi:DHA1 family bicyclomycin/chloramphenicol resistance-like MFS transporter|nr:MFS transporter [Alphaproteobacteria bacterium]